MDRKSARSRPRALTGAMTDDELFSDETDKGPASENDNAADPKSVRKKALRKKDRDRIRKEWWAAALASDAGRAEIWSLLVRAGTFDNPFQCGPNGFPQSDATFFALGAKSWGQTLYHALIRLDPAAVVLMHAENDSRPNQLDI